MTRTALAIALTLLAAPAFLVAQATKPAATTTRRADTSGRHPAIGSAIAELTKEIESALRSGSDAPRGQSVYFQEHPAADLPPQAVTAALRRPLASDPRAAAYVKWQLLSGLPKELDAKTAADLLQAYRAAPPPLPRPGIDKHQRDELDRLVRNARESDEEALSEQFKQMVDRLARDNQFILTYRDALFARLPPSYDAIAAGFEDAVTRVNVGTDAAEHTREVCKALETWATTAPPDQMKAMSRAIAQLQKKKGPEYYTKPAWSDSTRKLEWRKSQETLSGVAQLDQAQEFLDEKIKSPTVPLKLKEER